MRNIAFSFIYSAVCPLNNFTKTQASIMLGSFAVEQCLPPNDALFVLIQVLQRRVSGGWLGEAQENMSGEQEAKMEGWEGSGGVSHMLWVGGLTTVQGMQVC